MAAQIMFEGPKPLTGGQLYCTICAMAYKGSGTTALDEEIKAAQAERDGQITWLKLPPGTRATELTPAVAYGFFAPWSHPQFGVGGNGLCPFPMPLCWSHLMGANMMAGFIQPATPDQVPPVPKGAVDLAERAAQQRRAGRG